MHESGEMRIRVRTYAAIFNEIDSSPLLRRDLNAEVAVFLEEWAREIGRGRQLSLVVTVVQQDGLPRDEGDAAAAIHAHFARAALERRMAVRRLLRQGEISLVVGLAFLALLLFANTAFAAAVGSDRLEQVAETGFVVAGWVALWRPMEIFLYDWWPIVGDRRLYDRLAAMPIRFEQARPL